MPLDTTVSTSPLSMEQHSATFHSFSENDLLIRRSRVRNPPGSLKLGPREEAGVREKVGAVDPLKRAARVAVGNALALGKLRRGPCEQADQSCSGPVQAHHDDYAAPLAVRWLCRGHHMRLHRGPRKGGLCWRGHDKRGRRSCLDCLKFRRSVVVDRVSAPELIPQEGGR